MTPPFRPGLTKNAEISFDGLRRWYRLHLPSGYDRNAPTPLVLNFHGCTGTALENEYLSEMSPHADAFGYIVVYPQSTKFTEQGFGLVTSWNDLTCNASPGPEGPIRAADAFVYPNPPECGE